jgi:ketosteroid isomerase-like protein
MTLSLRGKASMSAKIQLSSQNSAVLGKHVAAETQFDMEATLATLTQDCVFEDVPTGELHRGWDGVRAYYREWWDAFGNVPSGSKLYVPSEDCLIVETHFVGVHQGMYRGHAASGRPIRLPVAIVVSFQGGLMSGERFYYDRATLLSQISE